MRTLSPQMQAMLLSKTTTFCFCWVIQRPDGVVMAFTDHDVDLLFDPGLPNLPSPSTLRFEHSSSFMGSAIENQLGLAVSNMEVMGALSSEAITEDDLECGRYDGAVMTLLLVDYKSPSDTFAVALSGTLGQVTIGDLAYQCELRSLAQHFQQYIGALCAQKCRSDLFDTTGGLEGGCNLTEPDPFEATVVAVTNRGQFQVRVFTGGTFPAGTKGSLALGYFSWGDCAFTSGRNAGLSLEIDDNDDADGGTSPASRLLNVTIVVPFPDDITVGDTLTLQIGCDKTWAVCSKNYANGDNFRAEPYVPGTDILFFVAYE